MPPTPDINSYPLSNYNPGAPISSSSIAPSPTVTGVPTPTDDSNHSGIINGVASSFGALTDQFNTVSKNQTDTVSGILDAMNALVGKAGDTATAYQNTGATDAANTITQLAAQSKSLQAEASAVPIQTQQRNSNTGATDAGVAPQDTGALRNNALKALSLSQQADIAQGNYTVAKDKADQIINLKYAPIEAQQAALQKQYDLNKDSLSAIDSKRTEALQANITLQSQQTAQAKQNETDAQAIKLEAAKAGNVPASVMDALSKTTNPTDALKLAAPYLGNSLANQLQRANIEKINLDNTKAINDAKNGGTDNVTITDPNGKPVTVPTNVAPYYNTSNNGTPYVDASALDGTAADKTAIINSAQAAGLKIITNKNTAADLVNIKDANDKLDSIGTIMAGLTQPNFIARDLGGLGLTSLSKLAQTDPQKAAAGSLQAVGLDMLKAISGVQGFRGNSTVVKQINDHMPTIYDTTDTANQKIAYIRQLITDRENAIVGKPPSASTGGTATAPAPNSSYTDKSTGFVYKISADGKSATRTQ
jgi:hypothetical protein